MKYFTPFIITLTTLMSWQTVILAQASPSDSYEILDGPTAPEANNGTPASPLANAPAITPQEAEDGEGVEYNIVASKPPCTSSTCISQQMIANADHAFVYTSPVKSYLKLTQTPDEEMTCADPIATGMTFYKQTVEDGVGKIIQEKDAFCLNQGCVYFGEAGAEKCE